MYGGEGLAIKVGDTITEIVVMRCDEASLIAVKGVADLECRAISITMVW